MLEKIWQNETCVVWWGNLRQPSTVVWRLRQLLSLDELQRADRFVFEKDRQAYTVARGLLRQKLAEATGREPNNLTFEYNNFGKPFLVGVPNLSFNLSHSGDGMVLAISDGRTVGIDLEDTSRPVEIHQIAPHFFAPQEVEMLNTLPDQVQGFFTCWTRKEAYVKARGKGLSIPLDQFVVTLDDQPKLLWVQDMPEESSRWQFVDVPVPAGYKASLIMEVSRVCEP